jgi:hypothetical protein
MKIFKNLLILILIISIGSCKDNTRGGDNESVPYNGDGIGGTFATGTREKNLTANYIETFNPIGKTSKSPCINEFTGKNLALDQLNTIMSGVDQKVDCQKKCPNNYSILKRQETPFNRLAFINARCNFNGGFGGGVCTGMVKTMQAFHHLAFWDESKKNTFTKSDCGNQTDGTMNYQCKAMYKEKIRNILHNKQAQDIPGFSNLFEFSNHPVIQELIKKELVKLERDVWNPKAYTQKLISNDLESYKRPFLYINNNHGVWAWKKEIKNGKEVICIRDPNDSPPSNPKIKGSSCDDYIFQSGSSWHRIHRGKNVKIGPVKSIRSDNISHQAYQASVRNYCISKCRNRMSQN